MAAKAEPVRPADDEEHLRQLRAEKAYWELRGFWLDRPAFLRRALAGRGYSEEELRWAIFAARQLPTPTDPEITADVARLEQRPGLGRYTRREARRALEAGGRSLVAIGGWQSFRSLIDPLEEREAYRALTHPEDPARVERLATVLEDLDPVKRGIALRALAELGPAAAAALPPLIRLVERHPNRRPGDAELALAATRSPVVVPVLGKKLLRVGDWAGTLYAVVGLGRLGPAARGALPGLERLRTHWCQLMRDAVAGSIARITGTGSPPEVTLPDDRYRCDENRACESHERSHWPQAVRGKRTLVLRPSLKDRCWRLRHVPVEAMHHPLGDGDRLELTNRGEFGGDVALVDARGQRRVLVKDNGHSVASTPFGLVVLTGLSHGISHGTAHVLKKRDGQWTALRLAHLPGAPIAHVVDEDGTLLVASDQGIHVLSSSGQMDPVPCAPPVPPPAGAADDCLPAQQK
jgi:hypothetical protein